MSSLAEYTDDGNYLDYTLDALGNKTDNTYDAQTGELESVQYPNGAGTTTTYTYDEMYRLISAAASTGTQNLSAAYTYTDDYLTKITTGTTEYNFTYGDYGLRTSVKAGTQTLASYTYTQDGNHSLSRLEYGNNDFVSYTYDIYQRVAKETYEDGDTVAYKYDNDGLLASIQDSGSGRTTAYSYDLTGRLVKYRETATGYDHSVSYTYDQKNNLTQLTEKLGTDTYTTGYEYDNDNRIKKVTADGGAAGTADDVSVAYTYDGFGRLGSTVIKKGTTTVRSDSYIYNAGAETATATGQIRKHTQTLTPTGITATTEYEYDANGNITRVTSGGKSTRYTYDSQNQLIREDNQAAGKSWTWTYDKGGNIQSKKEYAYTTGTLGSAQSTVNYTYDSTWGDLLVSYNGTAVTYDTIGNPAALNGRSYTWEHGRELEKVTYLGTQWTNTYDANGLRTKRESTGKTYSYVYSGSKLTRMTVGNTVLYFEYDASGTPVAMRVGDEVYHYITNIQGDVLGFYNTAGTQVVSYTYDAWGKPLTAADTTGTGLAALNPLRYRGYVYDAETGLYYLQSRYYDPEVGRFINADAFVATGQSLLGYNIFAYCGNNPVIRIDPNGLDYRAVGAGIQLELTVGCYTVGFEIILYWDDTVCGGGGWIVAVYSYDGLSLDMTDPLLGSIIAILLDNAGVLMTGTEEAVNSLIDAIEGKVSGSVSAVLIFGNEDYTSPDSYDGPFTSVSGNISHAKGSFAYSSNSFAVSIGATSSKTAGFGISRTNYSLWKSYQFESKKTNAGVYPPRINQASSDLERRAML